MTLNPSAIEPDREQYDREFFRQHNRIFTDSASRLLPLVQQWLEPGSIVDVGCGQGAWLLAAADLGVTELAGFDGPWVDPGDMKRSGIRFTAVDLQTPLHLDRRYDLALCMEVAEHLPESRAEGLVSDLCSAADVVLFSAAAPLQGGTGHINEQRASYWASLFANKEFECFDTIRPRIWNDEHVGWWYRQNALLFATGNAADRLKQVLDSQTQPPVDVVHPFAFETKLRAASDRQARLERLIAHPTFRQVLGAGSRWLRGLLK